MLSAGSIMTQAAERMRKSHEQLIKQTTPDFTYELLRMRNSWRLKKVGDVILGDLSFRSCKSFAKKNS